jgi:hypothetical protein
MAACGENQPDRRQHDERKFLSDPAFGNIMAARP